MNLFVKNKKNNLEVFNDIKDYTTLPTVAHMMVLNPIDYIDSIIKFVDIFLFHYESEGLKKDIIKKVRNYNKEVGIVINPDTKLKESTPYLPNLDYVLIMSVYPGWSGQKFIPDSVNKVKELTKYKSENSFEIMVDGGITIENSKKLTKPCG